jgi:hypothetical protein
MGGSPADRAPRYVATRQQSPEEETKPVGYIEGLCLEMEEVLTSDFLRTESDSEIAHAEDENRIKRNSKKVSFANIKIRSHCIVIGDHPCCTMGFPLALGWDYTDAESLTLDKYEASRSPRRTRRELRTTSEERRLVLTDEHSEGEIRRAQRKLHRERSSSARLCERMSESFFREQCDSVIQ